MVKNFPNTNAKEKTSLKSNLPLYKPYAVGESKLLIADLYIRTNNGLHESESLCSWLV